MLTKLKSVTYMGVECLGVDVEVNISERGMPCFDIVGLANKEIAESRQRVRTALQNSSILFPNKRITVNLAPADIPKEGSFYDLPIAAGILCEIMKLSIPRKSLFFGELSLDGSLRYTKGALLLALYAKECQYTHIFIPSACLNEVSVIKDLNIIPVSTLKDLVLYLKEGKITKPVRSTTILTNDKIDLDFAHILGQSMPKRALEISAAGGHNLLMLGPPGSGKTLLAQTFHTILPDLTLTESIEVTKIYSVTGNINQAPSLIIAPPYRSPHHTISYIGIIGGGSRPHPGEITLAHRGVLFLDEFAEFSRGVIESLRQPLENGIITIVRNNKTIVFPARFILLAASNLCPCGYYSHPVKKCSCSAKQVTSYMKRISGPILDRIDLCVSVQPIEADDYQLFTKTHACDNSETIKRRVQKARQLQLHRFNGYKYVNAEMTIEEVKEFCTISEDTQRFLNSAVTKFQLSTRSYFKILKISRTIADLALEAKISQNHVAEALQYRNNTTIIS